MDASMAFPCFDQPDLKARFTLEVSTPQAWKVIANTAPRELSMAGLRRTTSSFRKPAPSAPTSSPSPPDWLSRRFTGNYLASPPFTSANRNSPAHKPKLRKSSKWPPAASSISPATSHSPSHSRSTISSSSQASPSAAWSTPAQPSSTKMASFSAPRPPKATTSAATSLCCTRPATNGSAISSPCAGSTISGSRKGCRAVHGLQSAH